MRWLRLAFKLVFVPKVGGLLASLFVLLMPVGYDGIFKPGWEQVQSTNNALKAAEKKLEHKKAEMQQFDQWKQQLKGLEFGMAEVQAGQSPKVLAASQSSFLMDLAKGANRDAALGPGLPEPHSKREVLSLTSRSEQEYDILQPDAGKSGETGGGDKAKQEAAAGAPLKNLKVWRFDYELKVRGTYPALADLINQLIYQKQTFKLNEVRIEVAPLANTTDNNTALASGTPGAVPTNSDSSTGAAPPDSPTTPPPPAVVMTQPLDMTLGFSLFYYDKKLQEASV